MMQRYRPRSIRFITVMFHRDWKIKLYGICDGQEFISPVYIRKAQQRIHGWLMKSKLHSFKNYKTAILILHECREGCFAVINWWVDDNMLQHYVFLSKSPTDKFEVFSTRNGVVSCVWELSVLWFERNAWVRHVLATETPDFEGYLNEQLNQD